MKFTDLHKNILKSILLEAEGKNTHLEHLEDNILNGGGILILMTENQKIKHITMFWKRSILGHIIGKVK